MCHHLPCIMLFFTLGGEAGGLWCLPQILRCLPDFNIYFTAPRCGVKTVLWDVDNKEAMAQGVADLLGEAAVTAQFDRERAQ